MDQSGLVPGPAPSLGLGGQLLQQRVGLALGRFHAVGPHDAGGPVEVEHHHQLLPLLAELLDLGLQLRVDHLQPLRLLHRDTGSGLCVPSHGSGAETAAMEHFLSAEVRLFLANGVSSVFSAES